MQIGINIDSGTDSELGKLIHETGLFLSSIVPIDSKNTPSPNLVVEEVTEEQRQQLKTQADMLLEQGDLDETQSLYDDALTAYHDALEIYTRIQDAPGITQVHHILQRFIL